MIVVMRIILRDLGKVGAISQVSHGFFPRTPWSQCRLKALFFFFWRGVATLPETNIAPKRGWLEYYFPIGFRPIFRGELLVSERVTFSDFKIVIEHHSHQTISCFQYLFESIHQSEIRGEIKALRDSQVVFRYGVHHQPFTKLLFLFWS